MTDPTRWPVEHVSEVVSRCTYVDHKPGDLVRIGNRPYSTGGRWRNITLWKHAFTWDCDPTVRIKQCDMFDTDVAIVLSVERYPKNNEWNRTVVLLMCAHGIGRTATSYLERLQ